MGLDVGVVKTAYLEYPGQPVYDFLWELADRAGLDDTWGHAWEGAAVVELLRDQMESKARAFARKQNLGQEDSHKLLSWVRGLPWDGNTVMLHLSW
jgi:hypothetical protein